MVYYNMLKIKISNLNILYYIGFNMGQKKPIQDSPNISYQFISIGSILDHIQ